MTNHDPATLTDTDDADDEFGFVFPPKRIRRDPDDLGSLIEALEAERLHPVFSR